MKEDENENEKLCPSDTIKSVELMDASYTISDDDELNDPQNYSTVTFDSSKANPTSASLSVLGSLVADYGTDSSDGRFYFKFYLHRKKVVWNYGSISKCFNVVLPRSSLWLP